MNIVRKLLVVLIAPIFTILLLATAVDVGFTRVAGQPGTIKHILSNSGVYKSVVSGLLDQSKQVSNGANNVSLSDPIVRAAAEKTFGPAYLQQTTETVIDSTYHWLDGKTPVPDFQIDLSSLKTKFAANVAQGLQAKLAALPVCTTPLDPNNFDAQTATCLPKGIDSNSAAASIQNDIVSGKGFLDHPVITADSVKDKGSDRSIFAGKLKDAPDKYQKAKKIPVLLILLSALFAIFIIYLSTTRRKGIRRVSITLLGVGIFMIVFAWGVSKLVDNKLLPNINNLNNAVLQDKVKVLIKGTAEEIDKTYWILGGVYIGLGVCGIAGTMLKTRSGKGGADDLEGEGKTEEDRIDLKEPDKAITLPNEKPEPKVSKTAAKTKPAAKPATRKINIL